MDKSRHQPHVVIINGKHVELSPDAARHREDLLREAVRATVDRYRPALERLEHA